MNFIQKVNPINKDSEKKKFLFDPLYNPQFEYEEEIEEEELLKYGAVSFDHFELAKTIIDKVIAKYETESKYLEEVEGPVLTKDEVIQSIDAYLSDIELKDTMTLHFSSKFVARTSVDGNQINIRLPIDHRKFSLAGTLNHELGTHYLRNLNEKKQPWYQKRTQYDLSDYLETEEGLAVINYYYAMPEKLMWIQALYYYAACKASQLSFSDLYKELTKYVDDRERRWKICLRVKRGIKDTSQPGVMTKDQVYLTGAIKMHAFISSYKGTLADLYWGKLAIIDLPKLMEIVQNSNLHLPNWIQKRESYLQELQKLSSVNFRK